jgi:SAM-dependent methyltransferase
MNIPCHVCGAASLREHEGFRTLRRVTSDCRPWPDGGAIGTCEVCGATQKLVDDGWRKDVARIYEGYAIYHQGTGAEQAVFDPGSGAAQSRSERIVGRLGGALDLPESGRLLDIGCGNGAFLRAFAKLRPGWRLTGTEITDRNREAVAALAQLERFHVGDHDHLDGAFDLVSLIHVLEHLENPVRELARLHQRLAQNGRLVVEVPFFQDNPFDLLIADHATHFTPDVLTRVLRAAGFAVVSIATDWVAKEISVVARPDGASAPLASRSAAPQDDRLASCLAWLDSIARGARSAAASGNFGIFGTSIAGVWLYGEVEGRVDFFLDEDRNRAGAQLFERPILRPHDRPAGNLFVALAPTVARDVVQRLNADGRGGAILSPGPLN